MTISTNAMNVGCSETAHGKVRLFTIIATQAVGHQKTREENG
jgi:hypothetical protein